VSAAIALVDLGRSGDAGALVDSLPPGSLWLEAARAIAAGDLLTAADRLTETGSRFEDAVMRLRAAEAAQTRVAGLDRALALFRELEATAYLRRAESLLAATA